MVIFHISMTIVECGYQFGHFHLHLVKCYGAAASQLISQLFNGLVKLVLSAKRHLEVLLQTELIIVMFSYSHIFSIIHFDAAKILITAVNAKFLG